MCPPPPSLELMATALRFVVLTLYSLNLNTLYTKDSIFLFCSYQKQCLGVTNYIGCFLYSSSVNNVLIWSSLSILFFPFHFFFKELVNLLLCGQAVSNVFDDEMKLDSGNGNFTLLKGIKARCNIGLLSLFEHYNICKVRRLETL